MMEREVVAVGVDVIGFKWLNLDVRTQVTLDFIAGEDHLIAFVALRLALARDQTSMVDRCQSIVLAGPEPVKYRSGKPPLLRHFFAASFADPKRATKRSIVRNVHGSTFEIQSSRLQMRRLKGADTLLKPIVRIVNIDDSQPKE
jgi:hypothetical protein